MFIRTMPRCFATTPRSPREYDAAYVCRQYRLVLENYLDKQTYYSPGDYLTAMRIARGCSPVRRRNVSRQLTLGSTAAAYRRLFYTHVHNYLSTICHDKAAYSTAFLRIAFAVVCARGS